MNKDIAGIIITVILFIIITGFFISVIFWNIIGIMFFCGIALTIAIDYGLYKLWSS